MIAALSRGDVASAPLDDAERALLEYVELITRHAYRSTAEDVERLRSVGWTDEQIAEAVYITALFAFFNRVADAFGLEDPNYFELARTGKLPVLPGTPGSRRPGARSSPEVPASGKNPSEKVDPCAPDDASGSEPTGLSRPEKS